MKSECSTCKGCAFASVAACQTGKATHSRDKMYHAAVLGRCHPIQTMTQEHRDIPNHHICVYLSFHQRCLCLGHYFLTCIQRCSKKRVVISYLYIVSTSGAFAPQFSMQISANLKASRGKPKFLAPLNSVI